MIDTRARDRDLSGGDDQESSWQRKTDTHSLNRVVETLTAVIDVANFSRDDREKLVTLVQSRQSSNNDENEFPGHGPHMIDVLTDLPKKGQTELDHTHHSESHAAHIFAMQMRPLEDQRTQDNKALEKRRRRTQSLRQL